MITQKELQQFLDYNLTAGVFIWKGGRRMGKVAGTQTHKGYTQIKIKGKCYRAGRLAILYVDGAFPEDQVDHRNRIRNDDRYDNLICCSQSYNMQNVGVPKNNTTGIRGVGWCNTRNMFTAKIVVNNKFKGLGYFDNKIDAIKARLKGEQKYNRPSNSSAYKYLKNNKLTLKEI